MTLVGTLLLILFLGAAAWAILWYVPKRLAKSALKIPATVPSEWIEEFRRDES